MVDPSVIGKKLDDSEEGTAGIAVETVGFVKVGMGRSICVGVEVVSNVEIPLLVVRVMNTMTSMINLQRERFVRVPHRMP